MVVMRLDVIRFNVTLRDYGWKIILTHGEVERRLSMPTKSVAWGRISWMISTGKIAKGYMEQWRWEISEISE